MKIKNTKTKQKKHQIIILGLKINIQKEYMEVLNIIIMSNIIKKSKFENILIINIELIKD